MRLKFKSIIVISIFFLSFLFINWNFNSNAKSIDYELNNTSTSRTNNLPRAGNFDWGQIEVISEPIPNENKNIGSSYNPKIAVEDEKIYMVWYDNTDYYNSGTDWDIFYRYFDGNQWSEIQVISEPVRGQNYNIGSSTYPDIAVENGKIYVVWHDNNISNDAGTDWDIFYRYNITGSSWEDIQVISEPVQDQDFNTDESQYPSTVVENGNIYVVWTDLNNTNGAGTDSDIFYRSNITGSNWENIQIISEPIFGYNKNIAASKFPEIAVDNGKIHVVWEDRNNTNYAGIDGDIFYRCNLSGSNWEPVQIISEPVHNNNFNVGNSEHPCIAVENGKSYIVWQDEDNTNSAGTDWDIFYRCNLTNTRWEPIQVISESIIGNDDNTGESSLSAIMVKNNKIYVVWQDTNNTNIAGMDWDIFYRCNLTETNWEDILIISEPIMDYDINNGWSGSPDIAVNSGKSHIVWFDKNNSNSAGTDEDIFYRDIHSPLILSHPSVAPIIHNTNPNINYKVKYTHLNNMAATKIIVNISGIEYSMMEIDPNDTNYIDGKNYFFNIKHLNIGIHTYQFYASDGLFGWSTVFTKKPEIYNSPPNITTEDNLTAFEDTYYKVNYQYEDIDLTNIGQIGTWKFSTNAEWLTFDSTNAILNGTPTNDQVGKYWVNITIDDTIDIDFTNFTLTVININDAPVIITNDTETTYEDEFYEIDYEAIDVDNLQKDLIWSLNTNANWLNLEPTTTVLSGTPENDDVGESWVNISVSDNEYIDYSNFTLEVINVNDPPSIITEDIIIAAEDEYYEIDYEVIDVDNTYDELFWNITTNAKWLMYNSSNSIINGTPSNDDVGEYWVSISVSDIEYLDNRNFTLTVKNINDPPIITTKNINKAIVGQSYSVNYEVIDVDPINDKITWKLETNADEWLTIDSITGWLNGEPSDSDVGKYWVNVSVNDGKGGSDYQNFTFTVESSKESNSKEKSSWSWLIWVIIIVIVIISVMVIILYKKHKASEIPTVKAELLHAPPKPLVLPSMIPREKRARPLPSPQIISEQLPAPTPGQTLYQLPRATLSKIQKLELLEERFLRGEVDLETYKELKDKINGLTGEDITKMI